jgi:proteasome lid subunit RPN8/RPN11
MKIILTAEHLRAIEAHGESTYPNEGAGFLMGKENSDGVQVEELLPLDNQREADEQYHRYEIDPLEFIRFEDKAEERGLKMVGVFHSHPDHPALPSAFDREHAWPNLTYLITRIANGTAEITTAWRLRDDHAAFEEDTLEVVQK